MYMVFESNNFFMNIFFFKCIVKDLQLSLWHILV